MTASRAASDLPPGVEDWGLVTVILNWFEELKQRVPTGGR